MKNLRAEAMSRRRNTYTFDHLAMLVDRAVDVGPDASDLDVGLVDEPAIPARCRTGRAASINQGVNRCTHR